MNTQTFLHTLNNNRDKALAFYLPDGNKLGGDLHITEVMNARIESTDCGSNSHNFEETTIQLWRNEHSGKTATWTVDKAIGILDKVGEIQPYMNDSELFFEYGDSELPTSRYSVKEVNDVEGELGLNLYVKAPVCKPSLAAQGALACC